MGLAIYTLGQYTGTMITQLWFAVYLFPVKFPWAYRKKTTVKQLDWRIYYYCINNKRDVLLTLFSNGTLFGPSNGKLDP